MKPIANMFCWHQSTKSMNTDDCRVIRKLLQVTGCSVVGQVCSVESEEERCKDCPLRGTDAADEWVRCTILCLTYCGWLVRQPFIQDVRGCSTPVSCSLSPRSTVVSVFLILFFLSYLKVATHHFCHH